MFTILIYLIGVVTGLTVAVMTRTCACDAHPNNSRIST